MRLVPLPDEQSDARDEDEDDPPYRHDAGGLIVRMRSAHGDEDGGWQKSKTRRAAVLPNVLRDATPLA